MRYLRSYPRVESSRAVARVVKLRWTFDCAREPEHYSPSAIGKIIRERADVLVLHDIHGEILTRYRLVARPKQLWHPERQAYALLVEL